MMNNMDTYKLYAATKSIVVFRVFDPVEDKFCSSGHSLYGKGRTIWMNAAGATLAKMSMPTEIQDRLVIKKFRLVEE
jgi:hypothetical protein